MHYYGDILVMVNLSRSELQLESCCQNDGSAFVNILGMSSFCLDKIFATYACIVNKLKTSLQIYRGYHKEKTSFKLTRSVPQYT